MSEMPDFEPTVPPVNEYPAPKKPRKKPTKRRKAAPVDRSAAIRFGKAKAKKQSKIAKRRGRPPGALGKPKTIVRVNMDQLDISGRISAARSDVVGFLEKVLGITVQPWQAAILRKMVREA